MEIPAYAIEMTGHALLFFMVFGMSATVDLACVLKQLRNSRALCMGVFLQYAVLPFLGFITVKMLALDNAMGMTLLVVTSSPGGSFSNWWCSIFNADLALSVTMTGISTILALVMLPLNLYLYSPMIFNSNDEVDFVELLDFGALATSLVVVFSAIGLGIFFSVKVDNHNFHIFANRLGSFAGVWLVLLSGIASSSVEGSQLWNRDAKFFVGVAMPCVIALILSNILTTYSGLKKPERVTTSIECCYQNCGIATSVALSMFQGDELAEAMGVPFFYGLVEFTLIGMYCIGAWKKGWTKAPPNENFWKVITVNYEVLLAEKLAKERNSVEVQLSDSYVHVEADGFHGDLDTKTGALGACLYYCHEPDMKDVDPPANPITDGPDEKKEKLDVGDGNAVEENPMTMKAKARRIFWESLGYKI